MIRDVISYDGIYKDLYSVDDTGVVWSKRHNKSLAGTIMESGYLYVHLCNGGRGHLARVHRLIAEAFVPNPHNLPQVNHKNGNKLDNRVDNLEWVSALDNMTHARSNGLWNLSGENNPSAKLTWKDVRTIRDIYVRGDRTFGASALARRYGVASTLVDAIVHGDIWKEDGMNVTPPITYRNRDAGDK